MKTLSLIFIVFSLSLSYGVGATPTKLYYQQKKQASKERLLSKHPTNKALKYSIRNSRLSISKSHQRVNKQNKAVKNGRR